MYIHESIAKAKLKGTTRTCEHIQEDCHKRTESHILNSARKSILSKKALLREIDNTIEAYRAFGLGNRIFSRNRTSWHKTVEAYGLTNPPLTFEGVGEYRNICITTIDTRSVQMKGFGEGWRNFVGTIYVLEHFLLRGLQRTNAENIKDIGDQIMPFIMHLIVNNVEVMSLPRYCYFVSKDYVYVGHRLDEESGGLLMKTILNKSKMDKNQMSYFSPFFDKLEEKNLAFILVNEREDEIFEIPYQDFPKLGHITEHSNWLHK